MRIRIRPLTAAVLSALLIGSAGPCFAAPLPAGAPPTETPAPSADSSAAQESAAPAMDAMAPEGQPDEAMPEQEMPREPLFSLRYQIGGDLPRPLDVYEEDPFTPLLNILRESATAALSREPKPSAVKTTVEWPIPDEVREVLGQLPPLGIVTSAFQNGTINSLFEIAPYQRQVTKEGETGTIDWQGLNGQMTYKDAALHAPRLQLTAPGGHVHVDEDNTDLGFKGLSLDLSMNEDWEPRTLALKLPEFSFSGADGEGAMHGLHMEADIKNAPPGVDVGTAGFGFKSFTFRHGEEVFQVDDLTVEAGSSVRKAVVDTTLSFHVAHAFLSDALSHTGAIEFSYDNQFELRNIDAQVLAEIQKTVREMQRQVREGQISEEMVGMVILGKAMEVLPRLWKRSPVLAMPRLRFASQDGAIEASFSISVDGSKPLDTTNPELMKAALQGKADFQIAKGLLEHLVAAQFKQGMADEPAMEDEGGMEPAPTDGGQGASDDSAPKLHAGAPDEPATADAGEAAAEGTPGENEDEPAAALSEAEISQRVQAEIAGYVAAGFLVLDGADYRMKTEYRNGMLMMNGREMPLPF